MKSSSKRVVSFIACLTLFLAMCLYPIPAEAAGAVGVTFSDGDADHVYFHSNNLSFNLTNIPNITVDTPARVSFGLTAQDGSFVPTNIFTASELTDGSGDGTGYYKEVTILASGGAFSADVSGTIDSALTIGAIAVKIYVDMNGPAPGGWTNMLQGQMPDCIPLSYGSDPALVGVDTVMKDLDINCDPGLGSGTQAAENLYDIDVTFSKTILTGVTGSISFTDLNLFESYEDLHNLDEGVNMYTTTPAIDEEESFIIGINQSALSNLADDGATISVTSTSFSGLSIDAFDTTAVSGNGTISNLTIVGDTVSFDVNHFSDYKLSRADLQAKIDQAKTIIGTNFTAVEGVDTNIINSLEAKTGMNATGVDITIVISKSAVDLPVTVPTGALTYNSTSHTGSVNLELSCGGLTDSAILTSVSVPAADTVSPVPGNSGTITASSIGSSSLVLNWTTASDNISSPSALKYQVIKSNSNNISTGLEMQANGTLLTPVGVADMTSYTVTGLSPSTTYYFNVAVCDQAGKYNAYTTVGVTTSATSGGSGGGGGGGGGGTSQTPQPPETVIKDNTFKSTATVTGTMDSATGKTTATVTNDTVAPLIENAKKAETSGQQAVVEFKVTSAAQAKEVAVEIPKTAFTQVAQETKAQVSVASSLGTVTFDEKAVQTINDSAKDAGIQISIAKVDTAGLSSEVQAKVGNAPVYDFSVKSGTSEISQFGGGNVIISVPYTLKSGESVNSVVVYYINASGELETVRGAYDPDTGTVQFTTNHFSKYAIAYNEVTFDDVSATAWYKNAIDFIAARKITTGIDENNFGPNVKLTRAQYLVMIMKAYGIAPADNAAANFADAGNTYYTGYLAKAKELGLSNGDGNNRFGPNKNITRQDMFTLLYRTLDSIGELPSVTNGKKLSDFSDSDQIKTYAQAPMETLAAASIISGNNGKLTPQGTSTRAEMAQVLYNLLSK